MTWLAAVLGGALGTAARHGINVLVARQFSAAGPYATAGVNLVGTFAIGVLAGALAAQRITLSEPARIFVFVGLLGGFTTFSSLMLDSLTLAHAGSSGGAAVNLLGQVVLGLVLVVAGYRLGFMASLP
jgi:CrcB protein